jgi:cell wall-associated NlpC family hydrolase
MEKNLPRTGRISVLFPEHLPLSFYRQKFCFIYPAVFIIIMLACLTSPSDAQHRAEGNSTVIDTLTADDYGEEGFYERENTRNGSENEKLVINKTNERINKTEILKTVMDFMGVRYKKYGNDSSGFDCSGFTLRIFHETCGILMPHSSRAQYALGKHIARDVLRFGDLVFFTLRGKLPSHVGIYLGDGLFAHASIKRGVTVSILDSDYYVKRYFGACRILE